jgi:hypothetical protein
MEMEKQVIYAKEVELFLDELLLILFEKGYFGFPENAKSYIDKIIDFVGKNAGIFPGKDAPDYFNRYGTNMKYIIYQANKSTTWYVFYQQRADIFLVRHIANNHTVAQHL